MLEGKTSHAAEPEHGLNPAAAVAELLQGRSRWTTTCPRTRHAGGDPGACDLGSIDYGISAGRAEVHLTLRCWHDQELEQLEQETEDLARKLARDHGPDVRGAPTPSRRTRTIRQPPGWSARPHRPRAISSWSGTIRSSGGEDFGLFTARHTGCMFGLGSGERQPALHNPDYDFP